MEHGSEWSSSIITKKTSLVYVPSSIDCIDSCPLQTLKAGPGSSKYYAIFSFLAAKDISQFNCIVALGLNPKLEKNVNITCLKKKSLISFYVPVLT